MLLNFPNQFIHVLLSVKKDPTIPSSEYQSTSRHWRWRAAGKPPTDSARQSTSTKVASLTFHRQRTERECASQYYTAKRSRWTSPFKISYLYAWVTSKALHLACAEETKTCWLCAVDAFFCLFWPQALLKCIELRCNIIAYPVAKSTAHLVKRTQLCYHVKKRSLVNNAWLLHKITVSFTCIMLLMLNAQACNQRPPLSPSPLLVFTRHTNLTSQLVFQIGLKAKGNIYFNVWSLPNTHYIFPLQSPSVTLDDFISCQSYKISLNFRHNRIGEIWVFYYR